MHGYVVMSNICVPHAFATHLHIYLPNTNDITVMAKSRRAAFMDEFFDIIEEVHCRQKGHVGSKKPLSLHVYTR